MDARIMLVRIRFPARLEPDMKALRDSANLSPFVIETVGGPYSYVECHRKNRTLVEGVIKLLDGDVQTEKLET